MVRTMERIDNGRVNDIIQNVEVDWSRWRRRLTRKWTDPAKFVKDGLEFQECKWRPRIGVTGK